MRKRTQPTYTNAGAKLDATNDECLVDYFSRLPDDIVIKIISRLSNVKEAARTSVLSSRWRCMWSFSTTLTFDATEMLLYLYQNPNQLEEESSEYISCVDKVLDLHGDSNIYLFRIGFDLGNSQESIINNWIYRAMEKEVKEFELNLSPYGGSGYHATRYKFSRQDAFLK